MNDILKLNLDYVNTKSGLDIYDIFNSELEKQKAIIQTIIDGKCSNMLGWKCLTTHQEEVVKDIEEYCKYAREKFEYFIVLGVGGSALGAKVIYNAMCSSVYNEQTREKRKAPKFFVLDNTDPCEINDVLSIVDLKSTLINVVSKSGTTTESMMHFLTIYDLIEQAVGKEKAKEHVVFTTDKEKGLLSSLKSLYGFKAFYVPSGVGGRFSVLSPVGLLPACMLNVDIRSLLKGAYDMQKVCESKPESNVAYKKAILEYVLNKKGVNMVVTMPYSSKLKEYSYWYAQLLAESIGKKYDRQGNEVRCGLTPVSALGATDQHSQLQLYMEGPIDKLIVFVKVKDFEQTLKCDSDCFNMPELSHLRGVEFGNLLNTERYSTRCGLMKSGIPNIEIEIEKVDEYYLGMLFMCAMYEIAYLGELYNVDAYNQPGVEFGKKVTLGSLGVEKYKEYFDAC